MTTLRKIEELLDLEPMPSKYETPEEIEEIKADIDESNAILAAADDVMDKIDIALPTVRDLDASDGEMDELADLASNSFKDLMELSMNVDPRFSGPIIQSASTLLGHAITAKMAKMDKKLKMVDLQLKKANLDQKTAKLTPPPEDNAVAGIGTVLDRNALLKMILDGKDEETAK
jgi:hypothetical protein